QVTTTIEKLGICRAVFELERAFPADERRQRQGEDAEVATDREVLDVVALDGEALLEGQLAAPVDLHRAGQTGLDVEPATLLVRIELHELHLFRPPAREAHLAFQPVP